MCVYASYTWSKSKPIKNNTYRQYSFPANKVYHLGINNTSLELMWPIKTVWTKRYTHFCLSTVKMDKNHCHKPDDNTHQTNWIVLIFLAATSKSIYCRGFGLFSFVESRKGGIQYFAPWKTYHQLSLFKKCLFCIFSENCPVSTSIFLLSTLYMGCNFVCA